MRRAVWRVALRTFHKSQYRFSRYSIGFRVKEGCYFGPDRHVDGMAHRGRSPHGNHNVRRFVLLPTELGKPRGIATTMSMRTVIIPAAGKGTRLLPATKVTAKELLPVYDRVAIDFAIDEAIGVGAERIIIVINTSKTAIREYLDHNGYLAEQRMPQMADFPPRSGSDIVFAFQDEPLGLGHAILCCKGMTLPGPFGVILPDDIIMANNCLVEMAAHYDRGHMVAAMQVKADETAQYGIFRLRGLPKNRCIPVSGMVEKPAPGTAPSSIAAVGRYILDPMIFDILAHTPTDKGGELQLTDAITIATHAVPLTAYQFSGTRYDCGNHDGLLCASIARRASVRNEDAAHTSHRQHSLASLGTNHGMLYMPDCDERPTETTAG
jgi:UTP--glucose-1-phosphate uridylyltransferase